MPAGSGVKLAPRDAEETELMQQPEVRAQIEQMQRRHYESWPEIPLPDLDGRTPLEAVKDNDGREMVGFDYSVRARRQSDAGARGSGDLHRSAPAVGAVIAVVGSRLCGDEEGKRNFFPICPQ
jgi:hypothetical protein